MNALETFLAAYPALGKVVDALAVAVPLASLAAFAGLGFICGTARVLAVKRRRVAYDKCSRQLSLLAVILGWALLIGSRLWLYLNPGRFPADNISSFLVEASWIILSIAVFLTSVNHTLWRFLREKPVLHVTLSMICGVMGVVTFLATMGCLRFLAAFAHPEAAKLTIELIFPLAWYAPVWQATCLSLPLMVAIPAAFGCFWLIMRRTADDFGRDYYNAMIPWCASWAASTWLLLWLLQTCAAGLRLWLAMEHPAADLATGQMFMGIDQNLLLAEGLRLLAWLLPAILWILVCRSRLALRHSLTLCVALVFAIWLILPWHNLLTTF